jgi:hypothetical protein
MKKKHTALKLCRTTIARLNDPMLQEVRGGNELTVLYAKLSYTCGGSRDTATVPHLTVLSACEACTATETVRTTGKV